MPPIRWQTSTRGYPERPGPTTAGGRRNRLRPDRPHSREPPAPRLGSSGGIGQRRASCRIRRAARPELRGVPGTWMRVQPQSQYRRPQCPSCLSTHPCSHRSLRISRSSLSWWLPGPSSRPVTARPEAPVRSGRLGRGGRSSYAPTGVGRPGDCAHPVSQGRRTAADPPSAARGRTLAVRERLQGPPGNTKGPILVDGASAGGTPERIRTAVTALRGRRPRPLDDGGRTGSDGPCTTIPAPTGHRWHAPARKKAPTWWEPLPLCTPERIRTAVTALRGRRPRPLDDGGALSGLRPARSAPQR